MEKNSILINTTRYIESCFKKDLPEALVEQISNFIPKVIQGLPVGADLDTFSCCYSLARTVLAKGGNRTYFARRRLINLFKKKLEMSGGYFPNQSVVAFARTYLETDSAALPKQLATMFHNLFSTTAPVDQFYIKDAVDTLLEDLKAKQPLVTPRCNSYFDALVQFIGRSDELGVHDVDVMSTMAKYILKQAEFKPELWSHIEGSHVLSKAAGGGLKLQLHHRAAHRLRLLTWMMLALGTKSADGDSSHSDLELGVNPLADEAPVASAFEILPEQIETLVSIALKGLLNIGDGEDVMEMGARDVKTLLLVLNAMKVLLWLHPASVCDIWPRLWEDLHALLFDQTDSVRPNSVAVVGSTLMFMLYVMQTGSELVSQCKAEWRSVCNAVMASYLPLETKPAKSIKMLVMQVKATFVCTVQRTISRHEIELRLLQDLGSLNAQTEFFTWAD